MGGVGEQRKRAGQQTGHQLGDHEAGDQQQRGAQRTAVRPMPVDVQVTGVTVALVVVSVRGHQLTDGSSGIRATSA